MLARPVAAGAKDDQFNGTEIMNANASVDEMRRELARLQVEFEVLEKSHRRLVAKVLRDKSEAEQFLGQMAVDRMMVTPTWLKK